MGLWSRFNGMGNGGPAKATVHDYTEASVTRELTLFKPLNDAARTFLSGRGKGLKVGDVVIVRDRSTTIPCNARYLIESVSYVGSTMTWRAYGRVMLTSKLASRNQFFPKRTT